MKDIIWLASYPKSGNTWFRFVLFHLHHARMPENSRELDNFISSKIPAEESGAMHFCKTHASFHRLAQWRDRSNKAIYIYRHPLDVMQSALNYAHLTGELEDGVNEAVWIENYLSAGGNPLWQCQPYDSENWNQNVQSWLSAADFPVLLIGYEQALIDPEITVARISEFLALHASHKNQARCALETSFTKLKEFEENELKRAISDGVPQGRFSTEARLKSSRSGVRFFNKGTSGNYQDLFTPSQCERAWANFSSVATKLNYSIDHKIPALLS